MNQLYAGEVPPERAIRLREELEEVRTALALFPPRDVVWDFEEPSARPPWGDDIAETITLLANYFVTDDGRDLIDVLLAAVGEAQRHGRAIEVS